MLPILERLGLKAGNDFYLAHCPERIDPGNKKYLLKDLPRVIGAFIKEIAKCFDRMGIDITEVIKGAATKPFAFMPHYPGCGVGGHCISVDPYYLIENG